MVAPEPAGDLGRRIDEVLSLDPAARALEFERRWYPWSDLSELASTVERAVMPGTRVGVLVRNRPPQVGLVVGLLRAGACVVVVNPARGAERVRDDVASLRLRVFAGEPDDLDAFVDPRAPAVRIAVPDLGAPVTVTGDPGTSPSTAPDGGRGPDGVSASRPVAVEMLTSGTTGPPKRVPLTYETLVRVLVGAKYYERGGQERPRLRSGVAVVSSPMVHLGGMFRVLQCVNDGRSFCLLERFTVEGWTDAVRRHRPSTASLVPAALRMVLEADPDPADLSSLRSVVSGTAPLDPDDADAFTARYGVPVLVSYAATEFGGGVAGWNVADHRRHWAAKRGSVGRAHPGCELRIADPDTGAVLPADREGLLEVRAAQLGDEAPWIRTTDLARLDGDGFLWVLGRADQAIIRGGFKVRPEDVRAALERDPLVRAAAVVGRRDPRLGAVPVAAVELREPTATVEPAALRARAAAALARYELPAEIRIVDELPRTPSGKVDLAAVRALFAGAGSEDGR